MFKKLISKKSVLESRIKFAMISPSFNPILLNVPKWSPTHFNNLIANAARFLKYV